VECQEPELVTAQLDAVLEDIPPAAAKTGALGNAAMVEAIAAAAASFDFPLVVDPVMISKHGAALLDDDARAAIRDRLIPRAALLTPNLPEAAALTGERVETLGDMKRAARALWRMGAGAALVKGGHRAGDATDVLYVEGEWHEFSGQREQTRHTHGTGCTYSAAITACLARGLALPLAVLKAKRYIAVAIRTNPGLGHGNGPVNHHAPAGVDD